MALFLVYDSCELEGFLFVTEVRGEMTGAVYPTMSVDPEFQSRYREIQNDNSTKLITNLPEHLAMQVN